MLFFSPHSLRQDAHLHQGMWVYVGDYWKQRRQKKKLLCEGKTLAAEQVRCFLPLPRDRYHLNCFAFLFHVAAHDHLLFFTFPHSPDSFFVPTPSLTQLAIFCITLASVAIRLPTPLSLPPLRNLISLRASILMRSLQKRKRRSRRRPVRLRTTREKSVAISIWKEVRVPVALSFEKE